MGDASRDMPGILQRESLSTGLPIENSPPGIQTIPAGARPGGSVVFGIVAAKAAETTDVSDSFAGADSVVAESGSLAREAFIAYSVMAAAMTRPNASGQLRRRERLFELFSFFIWLTPVEGAVCDRAFYNS